MSAWTRVCLTAKRDTADFVAARGRSPHANQPTNQPTVTSVKNLRALPLPAYPLHTCRQGLAALLRSLAARAAAAGPPLPAESELAALPPGSVLAAAEAAPAAVYDSGSRVEAAAVLAAAVAAVAARGPVLDDAGGRLLRELLERVVGE